MTNSTQRRYQVADAPTGVRQASARLQGGRRAAGASPSQADQTVFHLAPWCAGKLEGEPGMGRLNGQILDNQI
ncbi:MAG: hypothetical protein M3416_06205 [Acidobacteriota bacterium]|nr:hypothetical protein [Acidobacteriota bacterium]